MFLISSGGFFFLFVKFIIYGTLCIQKLFQRLHFMLLSREADFINSCLINELEGVTQPVITACCMTTIRNFDANDEQQQEDNVQQQQQQQGIILFHTYNVLQIDFSNMERD